MIWRIFTFWLTNTPRFDVKMRVAFRSGSIPTVRNNGTRLPTMSAYRFRRCWSFVHIWPRMRSISYIIESGTRRGRISRSLVISVRVVISWVLHFSHCWIYCFPEKKKKKKLRQHWFHVKNVSFTVQCGNFRIYCHSDFAWKQFWRN